MKARVVLSLLLAVVFAVPPALAADDVTVDRWLVLGPVQDALPAFHDEKPGSYSLDTLLTADRMPRDIDWPADGGGAPWFVEEGKLIWVATDAGDGRLSLRVPGGGGAGKTGVAWLATYLETDRWQSATLKVEGAHPRRVIFDREEIASGSGGSDEEVSATVDLTPGKHLVVITTLFDASIDEPWEIRATLERGDDAPSDPIRVATDPGRTIDIVDILDSPKIGSAAVSTDGTLAATIKSRIVPGTSETETWIEMHKVKDRKLKAVYRGIGARSLAFVPGQRQISYITTGEGEKASAGTLWLANVDSGQVAPLLERVENLEGYLWSPTGKSIVYSASVETEKDDTGVKRIEGLFDRRAGFRKKSYLFQASVPDGVTRRLTAGPVTTTALDITRDGKRLLFTRQMDDVAERPFSRTEIWEMDLETLETRLLREARWFNGAVYSPKGDRILVVAGPSAFDGAGANVPEGVTPNDYDGQVYIWDPASGDVDAIGRDFDPSVLEAVWSADDDNIYLRVQDRDFTYLYRYDTRKESFEKLKGRFEAIEKIAVADDAPVALVVGTSPWIPQGLVAVDLKRGEAVVLKWGAGDWFSGTARGATRVWSFTASSGRKIDGRLYLPPDFDEGRKYPCIVYYYGGVTPTDRGFGGRYPKEYWASQGYVVYVLQPSGAIGYGQEFSALHVNDWGEIVAGEIVEGVEKFLGAHPFVDPERVGCIGASYGGFMTMRLVTRTDIFAAAVSHAGISSIASYWGEGYWGYQYSAVATAGSYPWNRRDLYLDKSPLFEADKVKTPILLTHGTADTNVPMGESDQFYTALKLVDAPVEYVRVEGQDHLILAHDQRLVWSRTIVAWFDRWLKGQPEWWEHLYPERE